jgi:hypothetical protein
MATASQSLVNMTVASDNGGGNQGLLMPKLQFRFRVNFFSFGTIGDTVSLTKQVIDCARPQVQFQEITLPVYNSTIYMAGKHTWQTMTINVRDDASGAVSRSVGAQVQKQLDMAEQASAASASDYKFSMTLEILDGGNGVAVPQVLETWYLVGCFLETVNYNNVNYSTNEDIKIALTVQFDNAIQTGYNGVEEGVGQTAQQQRNPTDTATSVA